MNRQMRQNLTWLFVTQLVFLSIFQSVSAASKDPGNAHASHASPKHYSRSQQNYVIPDIALRNRHGADIRVVDLLKDDRPILLQFVFTTCATICPVLSATFSSAQNALKAIAPEYRMVSISIDPEQDTPRTLSDYAERFKVGSQWHLLTGSRDKIAQIQHAFDAYYPGNNKMYHLPYTYLRAKGAKPWVRIDGLLSSADLIEEYRTLIQSSRLSKITDNNNE